MPVNRDEQEQEQEQQPSTGSGCCINIPFLTQYWVQQTTEAVANLSEISTIEQLIQEFYTFGQSPMIAAPFILKSLSQIRAVWEETPSGDGGVDATSNRGNCGVGSLATHLTSRVIQNTAQSLNAVSFPPEGSQFYKLFTGPNIRLEIIAVMFAIAGRASLYGLAHSQFLGKESRIRKQFAQKMLNACNIALHICKTLTSVNDLTVWLLHETLSLSGLVHGYSSKFLSLSLFSISRRAVKILHCIDTADCRHDDVVPTR